VIDEKWKKENFSTIQIFFAIFMSGYPVIFSNVANREKIEIDRGVGMERIREKEKWR
jgi:hypothetical protein